MKLKIQGPFCAQNPSGGALLTNADGSLTPRGNTILSHTPMGKFGSPDDLTGALLFLLDEEAAGFVNGIVLPVDGGFSAFSGV